MKRTDIIDRTLASIEERGMDKLNDVPATLRDMADDIERRLKRATAMVVANSVVTEQLRQLDSHLGILRESTADAIVDYVNVMHQALKEKP